MSLSQAQFQIHGGIHPAENKTQSLQLPLGKPKLPETLILPLGQHIGQASRPLVAVGDKVLKGQAIAINNGFLSSFLHAPTSGEIIAIEEHAIPHPSGLAEACIFLKPDGQDTWTSLTPLSHWQELASTEVVSHLAQMGIVGMGGAGFPTQVKLAGATKHTIHELIINAAECEPYITADDMLIREKTQALIKGIQVLQTLVEAERTLIGIEDNKPTAIKCLVDEIEASQAQIEVVVLPTKYPSGGEKQLIQLITGKEVPSGQLPADIGVMCQNVGTCVAVFDAIYQGKPLISRITTLTGDAMGQPQNVEALLGTPISHLLEYANFHEDKLERLVLGGPMMGFTVSNTDIPLVKTSNCILAATHEELPTPAPEQACIRCGMCEQACPASLLPQQLLWFSKSQEHEKAENHNLFDCIECGACSYVCPSSIPLVQYYRHTKSAIREAREAAVKSDHAKVRFEARKARIEAEAAEKEAKRLAAREKAAASAAKRTATASASPATKAAPQAATNAASDDQLAKVKKLKVDIAIANTKLKKTNKQLTQAQESADLEQIRTLTQAQSEQQAIVKELEDALSKLDQADNKQAKPSETKPAVSDEAKKAKVDLAIASTKLKKLQKQLAQDSSNSDLIKQVDEQESLVKQAQAKLDALSHQAPADSSPAKAKPATPASAELKKAKVDLAIISTKLKKLEKQLAQDAENDDIKGQIKEQEALLKAAQAHLASFESKENGSQPKTQTVSDNNGAALKKAKIDLALASTKLKKLNKQLAQTPDDNDLIEQVKTQEAAQLAAQTALDKLTQTSATPTLASAEQAAETKQAGSEAIAGQVDKDALKKAKIALAMASTKLKKAQKKWAEDEENAELKDKVSELEKETQLAQAALDALTKAPQTEQSEKAVQTDNAPQAENKPEASDEAVSETALAPVTLTDADIKKLKIEAAMAKASAAKIEKAVKRAQELDLEELAELTQKHQTSLTRAKALADKLAAALAGESVTPIAPPAPKAPDAAKKDTDKSLKIEHAMAKAALNKVLLSIRRMEEEGADEDAIRATNLLAKKAEKEQLLAQVESQLDQSETLEAEQARLAKRGQITKTVPTAKAKPANDPKEAEILEYEHLTHEERLAETKKQKIAAAMAKAKLTKLQLRLEKSPETASETQQEIEEVRQAQKQAQRILSTLNKLSVQEKN